MSEPKRPLNVFLCYTHVDKDAVKQLHDRLVNDGVDVWMDKVKLFGGSNWEYEIRKAVRDCDIFVVCVSAQFTKRFNLKNFSQTEVGIALNEAALKSKDEIFIIPVRLDECKVPKSLGAWHWVDLFETDGYQRLVLSLNRRIKQLAESKSGQSEYSNISIVISGNVQGNIIVGNNNAAQLNLDSAKEQGNRKSAEEANREKVRLEVEDLSRQKGAREKEERETAEEARLIADLLYEKTSKAITLENSGSLDAALKVYYEIRFVDPRYPNIEKKIQEIENIIRLRKEAEKETGKKAQLSEEGKPKAARSEKGSDTSKKNQPSADLYNKSSLSEKPILPIKASLAYSGAILIGFSAIVFVMLMIIAAASIGGT